MIETGSPKQVLKELYIGLGLYGIIFAILGIIFIRPRWIYVLSLLVGLVAAGSMFYNMYTTLDKALDMSAEKARSKVTVSTILRLVICCSLMIAGVFIDWASFVGVTVGLLGIKVSAYLNPLIKRIF